MDGSIQKYMAFVKTVECGSFTKAAEQLSYSQSGISRMINDLEKEWKVVLLERSKSGVKLTSSGMKLLPYAERVCREYEKLQLEVKVRIDPYRYIFQRSNTLAAEYYQGISEKLSKH